MEWLKKFTKKMDTTKLPDPTLKSYVDDSASTISMWQSNIPGGYTTVPYNPVLTTGAAASYGNITNNTVTAPQYYVANVNQLPIPTHILQLNSQGKEIVKLNSDGSVSWAAGIKIDEAAEAFSKTLFLAAELATGITKASKLKMRDSIFTDLISIAKEKGSLSAEDLTYLLEASKIVEKLKGGKYDA